MLIQPTEKLLILAGMCYHSIENFSHHEHIDRFRAELLRLASAQLCIIYFSPPEVASNTTLPAG